MKPIMNLSPFLSVRRFALFSIGVITILITAYAHIKAGFTFPNPWNDEPWFLWSVASMVENNTYFSASLNPERILLMSPYYQAPMMLLFKLTGFSFRLARWVSWAYMAVAYAGVLALVRRRPFPLLSAGMASLFFLGASAVVAGNMARPEAMVWAMAVWSFVLADRGQNWKALALAGLAVLVHRIAIVYFGGVLFLCLLDMWQKRIRIRPTRGDWIVIVISGVLLGTYLYWMIQLWGPAMADTKAVMSEGLGGNTVWERVFLSNKTPWLAMFGVLAVVGFWKDRQLLVPALLGGAALSTMLLRPQMWYEIYNQMAFMWITLLIPWTLVSGGGAVLSHRKKILAKGMRTTILLAVFVVGSLPMLKICYGHGFITGPNHYPAKLGWGWGMRMDSSPYITEKDIKRVLLEIESYATGDKKYRVFFMPEGDALFFYGRMPSNTIPYQGVRTDVMGDLAVFRLSRHQPPWLRDQHVMKSLDIYGGTDIEPFYGRDGTEKWILVPPR